jgi:hypothetical protein
MPKMSKLPKMPKIKDVDLFFWFQVSEDRRQMTEKGGQRTEVK